MPEYAGVDPQTGDPLWYKGTEGRETTNQYHEAGKRYLGSPMPDFSGSFNSTFRWKDLDFSVQLNYNVGNKIYGEDLVYGEQCGSSLLEGYTYYVYDNRWQKPGDITDVPRMNSEANYGTAVSSRYLMDGDYLIMMSDGVTEVLMSGQYGELFESTLKDLADQNPQVIAEKLLQLIIRLSGGHICDDMTILVAGIWEKAATALPTAMRSTARD
jgi:hypothetical protein